MPAEEAERAEAIRAAIGAGRKAIFDLTIAENERVRLGGGGLYYRGDEACRAFAATFLASIDEWNKDRAPEDRMELPDILEALSHG